MWPGFWHMAVCWIVRQAVASLLWCAPTFGCETVATVCGVVGSATANTAEWRRAQGCLTRLNASHHGMGIDCHLVCGSVLQEAGSTWLGAEAFQNGCLTMGAEVNWMWMKGLWRGLFCGDGVRWLGGRGLQR